MDECNHDALDRTVLQRRRDLLRLRQRRQVAGAGKPSFRERMRDASLGGTASVAAAAVAWRHRALGAHTAGAAPAADTTHQPATGASDGLWADARRRRRE